MTREHPSFGTWLCFRARRLYQVALALRALPATKIWPLTYHCKMDEALGKKLPAAGGHHCVDLDDFYWLPGWVKRSDATFRASVEEEVHTQRWVVCGNYSRMQSLTWPYADQIIWLDLPLLTCLWRALFRSFKRCWHRKWCCGHNRETLRRLVGPESILLWIAQTHCRRRCQYAAIDDHLGTK